MKLFSVVLTGLWLAAVAPVQAEQQPVVVVELFTSQGCSSCPPADALLGELAKKEQVLALSLHVDYWDYLGWKDRFAQALFSERQRNYAHHVNDRMVYTPQIIVGGRDRMVGSRAGEVMASVLANSTGHAAMQLKLRRTGPQVEITASPVPVGVPVLVQLVRYIPEQDVDIRKGENGGRTIRYHNVVTSWQRLGVWDGVQPLAMRVDVDGDAPLAVILQEEGPGAILAAARLR